MKASFFEQYPYLADVFYIKKSTRIESDIVDAKELISPFRLDFMAKLILVEAINGDYDAKTAYQLYEAHLRAFLGNRMEEPGQAGKCGLEKYLDVFHRIYETVRDSEGEQTRLGDPIPVDAKGMAMDGAHRIAVSIYFDKELSVYRVGKVVPNKYDFLYFRKRFLEEEFILEMVNKYVICRPCRLYVLPGKQLGRRTAKKIYNELAPVYMKKTLSKEWIILFDCYVLENSKDRETFNVRLGKNYTDKTNLIVEELKKRKEALLKQRIGYRFRRFLGIRLRECLDVTKRKVRILLGKPV